MKKAIIVICNSIGIIVVILAVSWGFGVEFYHKKQPCILCFLQRISLLGIGVALFWNLAFGVQIRHYAMALLWGLLGLFCSARHIALNACKSPEYGVLTLFSYHLYTWAFLVFFCFLVSISALLFFAKEEKKPSIWMRWGWGGCLFIVLFLGAFSAWLKKGWNF